MERGELTDNEWARLAPLLPSSKGRRGRPFQDHRRILNGILWIARTGAPWRDLPPRYGSWHTCHDRLRRWTREGRWEQLLQALQAQADAEGRLDWESMLVDSTIVRAHQHAAGAQKGGRCACR
jgi:transposase